MGAATLMRGARASATLIWAEPINAKTGSFKQCFGCRHCHWHQCCKPQRVHPCAVARQPARRRKPATATAVPWAAARQQGQDTGPVQFTRPAGNAGPCCPGMLAPRLAPPAAPARRGCCRTHLCRPARKERRWAAHPACIFTRAGQQVAGTCRALAHPLGSQTGRHLAQERRCGSPGGVAQLDAPSPCADRALTCGTRLGLNGAPVARCGTWSRGGTTERHHSGRVAVTVHTASDCPRPAEHLMYISAGPRQAKSPTPRWLYEAR